MKRFLRKAAIGLAYTLATLIVLIIIFYAEEDWRGARDWAACQKELQAKGETLDLRQLAPPGKPEDDLSKVPIFAEIYQQPPPRYIGLIPQNTRKPTRLDHISIWLECDDYNKYPKPSNFLKSQPIDLTAWQNFYRSWPQAHLTDPKATPAQDILQALSQFDPEWNEINAALNNPNAYWPLNYERPFDNSVGALTSMLRIAQVLPLKAVAHLDNHETDLAEKDYLYSFHLDQPLTQGCFLINYLILVGVRAIDDAILWEGIRRHAWSDSQLHKMESALASTDMLALAQKTFQMERASAFQTMKMMQAHDSKLYQDLKEGGETATWYFLLIRPDGWWDEDRCNYSKVVQNAIDAIHPDQGLLTDTSDDQPPRSGMLLFYTPITQITRSNFENMVPKIARAETYRRLARLACRLEEYRIAHAQYPDKLDELPDLPAHLNQEVLSEQPLRYQRKGDGYLLYSLGWNQKDDGGLYSTDLKEGDWPWPSP